MNFQIFIIEVEIFHQNVLLMMWKETFWLKCHAMSKIFAVVNIIYSTWLKIKGYLAHFEIWCFSKCAVVTVPHFWKSIQPPFIGILETHGSSTKKICMYDEPAAYLHLYFMIWFGWYHRHYSSFVYYSIIFCFYVWLCGSTILSVYRIVAIHLQLVGSLIESDYACLLFLCNYFFP